MICDHHHCWLDFPISLVSRSIVRHNMKMMITILAVCKCTHICCTHCNTTILSCSIHLFLLYNLEHLKKALARKLWFAVILMTLLMWRNWFFQMGWIQSSGKVCPELPAAICGCRGSVLTTPIHYEISCTPQNSIQRSCEVHSFAAKSCCSQGAGQLE